MTEIRPIHNASEVFLLHIISKKEELPRMIFGEGLAFLDAKKPEMTQ